MRERLKKNIYLQDDPLSALDHQVGQQIFDQGIRKLLLRSGRTVIMVTHRLEFLSIAHQVCQTLQYNK